MSSMTFRLRDIVKDIILKEVGEASSKPYFYKKISPDVYTFIVKLSQTETQEVRVDFEKFDEFSSQLRSIIVPDRFKDSTEVYNVGYKVGGSEFQFKKSNVMVLLRILSTVVQIIKEFIRDNDPDLLYIEGSGKELSGDIRQKSSLYDAFRWKQLDTISGYTTENRHKGFIIFKSTGR